MLVEIIIRFVLNRLGSKYIYDVRIGGALNSGALQRCKLFIQHINIKLTQLRLLIFGCAAIQLKKNDDKGEYKYNEND